jgi:hypothetical protein
VWLLLNINKFYILAYGTQKRGRTRAWHWAATRKKFLGALKVYLAANILAAILSAFFYENLALGKYDAPAFVVIFVGGGLLLLVDAWAIFWVGTWQGFQARSQTRAVLATLARVVIPGWASLPLLIVGISLMLRSHSVLAIFIPWMMLNGCIALITGLMARAKLAPGLRAIVEKDNR